jgi:hypothetical protein
MIDQAVGSYEAACLMGLHWTRPKRMADAGLLTSRDLLSPTVKDSSRKFSVYSSAECESDFSDYDETLRQNRGKTKRRPRGHIDLRAAQVKRLKAVKPPIAFGDAISTGEAAKILGVHWTFPPRLAAAGKIVGRVLFNARNQRARVWIFSRASCEANRSTEARSAASGKKVGRPRKNS